jgi:hypothetical protein
MKDCARCCSFSCRFSIGWSTAIAQWLPHDRRKEVVEGQSQARPATTAMFLPLREIAAAIQ